MKNKPVLFLSLLICLSSNAREIVIKSPDKNLKATIVLSDKVMAKVCDNDRELFTIDRISLITNCGSIPAEQVRLKKVQRRTVNSTIVPVVKEKRAIIPEIYNEMILNFSDNSSIIFRLYDNGFAYRIVTNFSRELTIKEESAIYSFDSNAKITYQQDHSPNSNCERPYVHKLAGEWGAEDMGNLPILVELPSSKRLLFLESDVQDYPYMWLKGGVQGDMKMFQWNCPKDYNIYDINVNQDVTRVKQVVSRYDYIAKVQGSRAFPWRIMAIANNDIDLINCQLTYLLASELKITDTSWIKPGWVILDWWSRYGIYGVDFESGVNTETAKYMIDFVKEFGMQYYLFDLGWAYKNSLIKTTPKLDMDEVMRYAQEKGVGIMLWVASALLDEQMEIAMDQFEKWGIKGLKIDFIDRSDQDVSRFCRRVAEEAAKRKMILNFHGIYIPDGIRRAYPNVLTREALMEFEYNGFSDFVTPDHDCTLPFIRNVAGPQDYIPGTMMNATKKNFRHNNDTPMSQGTRVHSMAMAVISESPMQMLPDAPTLYYEEEECGRFLTRIPVEWDETKPLQGKVGDYVAIARRNGDEWYVGAITDWTPRKLILDFDFLDAGKNYTIELFRDGPNASKMAVDYVKEIGNVQKGKRMEIDMAPGGGWLARIY